MVEVKNLYKKYGEKEALKDVSFSIKEGEILGFLGPNGAGKSTTMNIITGYISSSSGEVLVDGYEILKDPIKVKSQIGYLPETPPLYLDMTVKGYLSFMYDLKKVKLNKWEHIKNICSLVKIDDVYNRLIKNLSKGYKQRVGLAQALLGNPKVLILDEPTVGLDPKQIIEIRSLIKTLAEKHTILLSSHVLSEVQAVCNRVVVINKGKIVADDTTKNLSDNSLELKKLALDIKGEKENIVKSLEEIEGIEKLNFIEETVEGAFKFVVEFKKAEDLREEIFKVLASKGLIILKMEFVEENLEDVFLKLTDQEINE